jgi:hypothetical protein
LPVFDCEGDGLFPTKFHVLSYREGKDQISLTTHQEMADWLVAQDILIGHNIRRWDIPQLCRVLGIEIKARIVDTLALSWYLYPTRVRHGLEGWGEEFGVPKPVVVDWANEDLEVYVHRCEEDVKINTKLWDKQRKLLSTLYTVAEDEVINLPILKYLEFKLDCAAEQERSMWRLDTELARDTLAKMYPIKEEKVEGLRAAMPKVLKHEIKTPPAAPFKKDGTLSVQGVKWQALLREQDLPPHTESVRVVAKVEEPNPNSHPQLKDWLFLLGWEPATFKYVKDEFGEQRTIPQIQTEDDDKNKQLCPSVLLLIDREPAVELLEGLFVLSHRISILEGFLDAEEGGFIKAEIQGLTNTLRFKHKTVVNLPGVDKFYGKEIRGCLVAREGHELCGSDMTSLEDMTKRHYMHPHDPDYVEEMSKPGFDPHLDLAKTAGRITPEDLETYTLYKKAKDLAKAVADVVYRVGKIRKPFKAVNYSAIYGVGKVKLARTMGTTEKEADTLLTAYWKRNWAVKKIAEEQRVRRIGDQMWLYNPVSQFWYSLRFEKDIFSTLNQGTGVYCFDSWLGEIRKVRKQLTGQFHDEIILEVRDGNREACSKLLRDAIQKVNERLKLNVELSVDVQYGRSYADIH